MVHKLKRICMCLLIAVFLMGIYPGTIAHAASNPNGKRTVRIGYTDTIGYYQDDEAGDFGGVGYDYEDILAQYANWDLEYVEGTWSQLSQMLEQGEIDLLGFLIKTPEREKAFDFSNISFGTSESCLLALDSNTELSYEDYSAMNNLTVGYQAGNANFDNVSSWCDKNKIKLHLKEYKTTEEALVAVRAEEIDLALGTNYNALDGLKIIAKMLPEDYYYAVKKGNTELLEELDTVMEDIALYYPNLSDRLYANYYDEKNGSQVAFTVEEKEFLETKPVVYVYQGPRSQPYEFYDKSSRSYKGIVPDILSIISENTGIQFEYIHSEDRWGYLSAESGTNKMTTFTNDFSWAAQKDVTLTQPFVDSQVAVITKEPNTDIHTVAAVDNQYICEEVEKHYPDYKMVYYKTAKECYEAVLAGKCDATFANSIEADYFSNIGRFSILHDEISEEINQDVCFGITKDSDPRLTGIISKALLSISTEKCNTIIKENINESRSMGVIDLLYTNPRQLSVMILIMLVLLLVALVFVFKLRKANRTIREISDKDSVTHVYSRSYFENDIKMHFSKQKNMACLYLDLNGLHELNNKQGHQQGDLALQRTADVLCGIFTRKNVFRMGGDEFMVLCSNVKKDALEKMTAEMERNFEAANISTAYGLEHAENVLSGEELQKLVNAADEQMLEHKRQYYKDHDRRKR